MHVAAQHLCCAKELTPVHVLLLRHRCTRPCGATPVTARRDAACEAATQVAPAAAPVVHSGTAIQAPIPSFGLWSPCCSSGHGLPPHRAKQLRHVGSRQCRMPLLPRYQNAPVGPANQPRCTEAPVCRILHPNAPRSVTLIRRKRLCSHALHNLLCATYGASVLPTANEYCPEKGIPRVLVRHGSSLLKCWCSWCQLRTHKQRPGS